MEYTQHPEKTVFNPSFGYGYDPDRKEEPVKEEAAPVKDAPHLAFGMPRPKNDPVPLCIVVIVLLISLFIGALIASKIETRFLTRQTAPSAVTYLTHHDTD